MFLLRGETHVGVSALLVAGFDVSMNTQKQAKRFVQQHGSQGDLFGTVATLVDIVAQRIERGDNTRAIVRELDFISAILIETDRAFELLK